MNKFTIFSKIWEGEVQISESVGQCQNYRFFISSGTFQIKVKVISVKNV